MASGQTALARENAPRHISTPGCFFRCPRSVCPVGRHIHQSNSRPAVSTTIWPPRDQPLSLMETSSQCHQVWRGWWWGKCVADVAVAFSGCLSRSRVPGYAGKTDEGQRDERREERRKNVGLSQITQIGRLRLRTHPRALGPGYFSNDTYLTH